MMVVVQGTKDFNDYKVFLRSMGVALSNMKDDDKYFYIYSLGSKNVNNFVFEFCNLSERNMKARGKKIKPKQIHRYQKCCHVKLPKLLQRPN